MDPRRAGRLAALIVVVIADALRVRHVRRPCYVPELTDESAYERYVAHVRKDHPDAEVPSRRAFERLRTDRQEADPRQGFRCC